MTAPVPDPVEDRPADSALWLRWVGLSGLTLATVAFKPMVLVALPFILLAVSIPGPKAGGLIAAALALVWVMVPAGDGGLWYLERGWAILLGGWFVAITWRWPSTRFTVRALGALGATVAVLGGYFALNPETWDLVNWLLRSRVGGDWASLVAAMRLVTDVDQPTLQALETFIALQVGLYPSLIALSSFGALGVAWWWYVRLSHGRSNGLGALQDFAFPNGLVWVAIGGLLLVLLGGASALAFGYNTLLFMGVLYALRGLAVFVFFKGGVTFGGALLVGLITFLAAPLVLGVAVMIGLGDTWLGLRTGARNFLAGGKQ